MSSASPSPVDPVQFLSNLPWAPQGEPLPSGSTLGFMAYEPKQYPGVMFLMGMPKKSDNMPVSDYKRAVFQCDYPNFAGFAKYEQLPFEALVKNPEERAPPMVDDNLKGDFRTWHFDVF